MKEIWQAVGIGIMGLLVGICILTMYIFIYRLWRFINKKTVGKTPLMDYIYPFIIVSGLFLFMGVGISVGEFIRAVWNHINKPPYTVTVYQNQGRIDLSGPTEIPIEYK